MQFQIKKKPSLHLKAYGALQADIPSLSIFSALKCISLTVIHHINIASGLSDATQKEP